MPCHAVMSFKLGTFCSSGSESPFWLILDLASVQSLSELGIEVRLVLGPRSKNILDPFFHLWECWTLWGTLRRQQEPSSALCQDLVPQLVHLFPEVRIPHFSSGRGYQRWEDSRVKEALGGGRTKFGEYCADYSLDD